MSSREDAPKDALKDTPTETLDEALKEIFKEASKSTRRRAKSNAPREQLESGSFKELSYAEAVGVFATRDQSFEAVFETVLQPALSDAYTKEIHSLQGFAGRRESDAEIAIAKLLLADQCPYTVHLVFFDASGTEPLEHRMFTGSLPRQFGELLACLEEINGVDDIENTCDSYRAKRRDYPEVAVREALMNLIQHRRYDCAAFARISVYPDRLEFLSVGGLPQNLEFEDLQRGIAVPRHTLLCMLLRHLGYSKGLGLGLRKILASYERFTTKPEILITQNTFTLLLPKCDYLRQVTYSQDVVKATNSSDIMQASPSIVGELTVLEHYAREVHLHLGARDRFSRKDIELALRVSSATAIKILKDMVEKGLIYGVGSGKNRRYHFAPDVVWPTIR